MAIRIINPPWDVRKHESVEWNRFDWFKGHLKADTTVIVNNLNAVMSLDKEREKLTNLSESNKKQQLNLVNKMKNSVGGVK